MIVWSVLAPIFRVVMILHSSCWIFSVLAFTHGGVFAGVRHYDCLSIRPPKFKVGTVLHMR